MPVVAQTTMQVKLDSKLQMFQDATPVLDDMITNLTTNVSTVFSTLFTSAGDGPGLFEQMMLSIRTIPWKS